MNIKIFKTRIDNYTKKEILNFVNNSLNGNKTKQIVTVNAEFLLKSKKDKEFRDVLNSSDLNIPDSSGVNIAFWKNKKKMKYRYPGVDLTLDILKELNNRKMSVFLVTNKKGLVGWIEVANAIKDTFPKIKIRGENYESSKNPSKKICKKISGSDVVLCNFGAPHQEIFLFNLKNATIKNIKLVIGIGGTFDFLTNKLPRAPIFMRKIGFEWLYRVYIQPWRWRRVIDAVIIFPIKILISKK